MKYKDIPWLENEDYRRAEGHLRLALNDVFKPFNELGHHIFIPGAIDEVIQLAIDFSLVTRGIDKPIRVTRKKNRR